MANANKYRREMYRCSRCGTPDYADGSVRAQSGLCLDCWCYDENRKTDHILVRRIRELKGELEPEAPGTVAPEVSGGALLHAVEDGATARAAEKYMNELSIKASSPRQRVDQLSGGNQQKVVLAKWLYNDADILILDEPTRGIDVGAKYEIYLLMLELVKQGKAIIMISSELPEIFALSDRIVVMYEGQVRNCVDNYPGLRPEDVMQFALG